MTGLCIVPLQSLDRTTHQSNNMHQVKIKKDSIKYLHAATLRPLQDIWEKSVNWGYFNTWPVLTAKDINNMPKADYTIKVHLTQIREHTR